MYKHEIFKIKADLQRCITRIEEILEKDLANLQDAYYVEEDGYVEGFGDVDTSHCFCEDCAMEIKDDLEVCGHSGSNDTDTHCSFCSEPLHLLIDSSWMERMIDEKNQSKDSGTSDNLTHMGTLLSNMQTSFNVNGSKTWSNISITTAVEITDYMIDRYTQKL